jgi:hypothetical protein
MKELNGFSIVVLTILAILAPIPGEAQQNETEEIETIQEQIKEQNKKIEEIKPGNSSFLITGFTNVTYHLDLEAIEDSRFDHVGFSPIFLWKPSEKLFFEAELHIELEGGVHGGEVADDGHGHGHGGAGGGSDQSGVSHAGSTHFDLGYANMVYFLNDYITITAGKFLTPIGLFNERFHPTWINPLPIDPLGVGHGGPLPSSEVGLQIRGGVQAGATKWNYSLYVSNGPIFEDGSGDPERAGTLVYSNFSDNNGNKALGGRLSWLPLINSTLEIGISGQFASKTGDKGTLYEDIGSQLLVGDLSYIINSTALKGYFRLIGQYSQLKVDDALFVNDSTEVANGEPSVYSFENETTFYYGIVSYRPSKSGSKFIRNSELVFRYDGGSTPEGSKWELEDSRYTVGYNYWLQARSALKCAVSIGDRENAFYVQWALGF